MNFKLLSVGLILSMISNSDVFGSVCKRRVKNNCIDHYHCFTDSWGLNRCYCGKNSYDSAGFSCQDEGWSKPSGYDGSDFDKEWKKL